MNIDRLPRPPCSFSLSLSVLLQTKQQQQPLSPPYTDIFEFCYRHTHAHFFLLSLVFFLSLTPVSLYLVLLVCAKLAMYECVCMHVYNDGGEEFMYICIYSRRSATHSFYFAKYTCLFHRHGELGLYRDISID
jgi:hypothetical protein